MNLTMEQVREMDNTALRVLVAQLLGWTDIYEQYGEWEEERAFDYHGVPPGWTSRTVLPDWLECLDDAVYLVSDMYWSVEKSVGYWAAVSSMPSGDGQIVCEDTPARALVLAWIAWKLAQKE